MPARVAVASTAWNVATTWSPSGVPTAADDLSIGSGFTVSMPTGTTCLGRSLIMTGTAGLTVASTTALAALGDGTPGPGNVALSIAPTCTITLTGIGAFQFVSTSATQQSITTGGRTLPGVTIGAVGGSYILGDAFTSSGAFTHTAGSFDSASFAVTASTWTTSSANTKAITLGSSVVVLTSTNTPLGFAGTNQTLNAGTSTLKVTPSANAGNFGIGLNWYDVEYNTAASGNFQVGGAGLSCRNLTIVGQTQTFQNGLAGNVTCSGTFTFTGTSVAARPQMVSTVLGTPRTITAATVAIGNVDFADTTGAGAGSWVGQANTSIGDRLGNSGITVTPAVTYTRDATSGQAWSALNRWTVTTGSRAWQSVPLPQDTVLLDASSGSISTTDLFCLGGTIDMTGYLGTLTRTSSSTEYRIFGNVTLPSFGANPGALGVVPNTFNVGLCGRSTHTIVSNGQSFLQGQVNATLAIYALGGSYTATDAFSYRCSSASFSASIQPIAGAFTLASGLTHLINVVTSVTTTYVRSFNFAGATVKTGTTTASNLFNVSSGNMSMSMAGSIYEIEGASALVRSIVAGFAFGEIRYTVADSPGPINFVTAALCSVDYMNVSPGRGVNVGINTELRVRQWPSGGSDFGGQAYNIGQDTSNLVSQPNSAALQITGDITLDFELTLPNWVPGYRFGIGGVINPALTTGYAIRVNTTGTIEAIFAGVTNGQQSCANATGFAAGTKGYLRVQRASATGAITMYASPDGVNWTQLGATTSTTAGALVANTTDTFNVGCRGSANDLMVGGIIHRSVVYNTLMGTAAIGSAASGNIKTDINLRNKPAMADSFTESSVNAGTVSIGANIRNNDGRLAIASNSAGTSGWLQVLERPTWDRVKAKDIFGVVQGKLYVGAGGVVDTGCTNVHAGAADPTAPYVRQALDVSGSTFSFPVIAGNLLVAAVTSTTALPTWVTPAGYTVIRRNATGPAQIESYRKVATGAETGFTTTTTGGAVSCKCWEIVGADTIDVSGDNSGTAVTTLDAASAPLTTYSSKTLAVAIWAGNTIGASGAITNGYGETRLPTLSTHMRAATRDLPASTSTNTNFTWPAAQNPRSQLLVFKSSGVLGGVLGRVTTTPTERPLTPFMRGTLGRITSLATARPLQPFGRKAIGRITTVATARPFTASYRRVLGRVTTSSVPRALGAFGIGVLGRVLTSGLVRTFTGGSKPPTAPGHIVSSRIGHRVPGEAGHIDGARPGHIEP